ncbi:MAG: hypothetical protein AAGI66_09245 [Cyanobacteria bacterium P01_H01_bin.74]
MLGLNNLRVFSLLASAAASKRRLRGSYIVAQPDIVAQPYNDTYLKPTVEELNTVNWKVLAEPITQDTNKYDPNAYDPDAIKWNTITTGPELNMTSICRSLGLGYNRLSELVGHRRHNPQWRNHTHRKSKKYSLAVYQTYPECKEETEKKKQRRKTRSNIQ